MNHLQDRILSALCLSPLPGLSRPHVILTAALRLLLSLRTAPIVPADGTSIFESDPVALALPYKFCFKIVHRHRLLQTGKDRTGSESTDSDRGLNCSRLTFFTGCMDLGKYLPVSRLCHHLLSQSSKRVDSGQGNITRCIK